MNVKEFESFALKAAMNIFLMNISVIGLLVNIWIHSFFGYVPTNRNSES